MEVILLERINRLGNVGDVVEVKPGFARNFLLPTKKALRATAASKKQFEDQRAALEAQNEKAREAAAAKAKGMQNLAVTVVRQASEDGRLYGSVAVRDIADALKEQGQEVERRQIDLNTAIKNLGVYNAVINLHAEVQVPVKVHVARNAESPMPIEEEIEEEKTESVEAAAEEEAPAEVTEEAASEETAA